jgi:hypothetical protein
MEFNQEHKTKEIPRIVQFDVHGEIINVPTHITKHLPHIDTLINDAMKPNEIIQFDTRISPGFLKIIIKFFVDNYKISYLKDKLAKKFEEDYILICLLYLVTNEFIEKFYYPKMLISNKIYSVAKRIIYVNTTNIYLSLHEYMFKDENEIITERDLNKILLKIYVNDNEEAKRKDFCEKNNINDVHTYKFFKLQIENHNLDNSRSIELSDTIFYKGSYFLLGDKISYHVRGTRKIS